MGHGSGHPHGAKTNYEAGTPTSDAQTRTVGWATRRSTTARDSCSCRTSAMSIRADVLPIHAGNIRETPLQDIYRNAPIFNRCAIQQARRQCGACEYKEICGGSRARAYAVTGDPLAQEPCCIYQPKNWDPQLENEASAFCERYERSLQIVG